MSPTLHISLLGDFAVHYGDTPVSAINTPRLQSLLAYLVLHRNAPQPRNHVAYTFWPDSTDAQARSNLRTLLHRLRDALPQADRFLYADAHTLQWMADAPFTLDVSDFEAHANPVGDPAAAREVLEHAAAVYRGDLLPGCYDDWIIPERERLRQTFEEVLEWLVQSYEQGRDYQRAIKHGQHLLRHDPLHEATYRRLMRLYALNGDRAGALRVYHTCATVMARELAAEPSPATREVYERLVTSEEPATPPIQSLATVSPLVGRDQEWAQLYAFWRSAAMGQPRFVLLSGEAGIGKTRLAEELLEWANRQRIATAEARCYATEGDLAYAPVVAWLRARPLPPLDDVWLTELSRLLPEILVQRPDLSPPAPLAQAWQRQRLFEALARAMLGRSGPLLLVIDDLHWCDRETLEWLHYLLRFDARARLLIAGTARTEELGEDHPLASLVLDLRGTEQIAELNLQALDLAATTSLAASVAGMKLAPSWAARLHQEAEGNPLFVVEMVRSGFLREDRVQPAALPAKVEAVIKARLSQLSPPARTLAGVAASIGRAFTFDVLARVSGGDEASLVSALDQLWAHRIVRELGADAYDFSHDKIREIAYAELSLARRRLLHRQVAQALEVVHETDLDAVSSRVARHYERAGIAERAIYYYTRVADSAARVYANEDAIDYLRCALRLFRTLPQEDPENGRGQERDLELHERLGDILHLTGQYDQAREAYQAALAHVSEHDWISRVRLHRKEGNIWREQHHYERALTAYEKAEATLDKKSQDQATRGWWQEWVQIQLERMWVYYWLGEWRLIAELEGKIRPAVEQHSSPAQRVNFLLSLTGIELRRDRYEVSEATIANVRAALAISQDAGNIGELAWVRFLLGMSLLWRGDLDEAEERMLDALEAAEATGDVVHQSRCLTYLTILYRRRGQLDRVRDYGSRSLAVAQEADMPEYVGTARANLAYIAWREGDLAAVQAHGLEALALWHQLPPGHASCSFQWTALWPLIAVALTRDQVSEAVGYARALIDPSQLRLPDVLTAVLEKTIQAWQDDQPDVVQELLRSAISQAQAMGDL